MAYTYFARNFNKLDDAEITANRNDASNDIMADAAPHFAAKLIYEVASASSSCPAPGSAKFNMSRI